MSSITPKEPDHILYVEVAYITMLKMPHGELRCKAQAALCELLNLIANVTGRNAEDVQNDFESRAAALQGASK